MIPQLLQLSEPQRVYESNLSEKVFGIQDIKFIIKYCDIPEKPRQYNHLEVFEKILKSGLVRLVKLSFEQDEKIVFKYYAITIEL